MLLNKERCRKCKAERSVRPCPRLGNKLLGWKCCNALRTDLRCPPECQYAPGKDPNSVSPFPAFRADSNTEFVDAAKRHIDIWCYQNTPELGGSSPLAMAKADSAALLEWLGRFQYPANFPVGYLMRKLGLPHEPAEEPQSPETLAFAFFDAVITQDWPSLPPLSQNDWDFPDLAKRYQKILSSVPELQKTKRYDILHAGAADDGVSAIVVLELNQKSLWTVLLSSASGSWKVKQNFNGSPQLYYAQNQLFRSIAEALARNEEQAAWQLISQSLASYPDSADLHYYRAIYWQLAKQVEKSKEDFLNSLALDNHFFEAGAALAVLYLNLGELEPARKLLTQLRRERPDDLNVCNNLAASEAGLGNIEAAVSLWQQILATAPTYEPARKNLERYSK